MLCMLEALKKGSEHVSISLFALSGGPDQIYFGRLLDVGPFE